MDRENSKGCARQRLGAIRAKLPYDLRLNAVTDHGGDVYTTIMEEEEHERLTDRPSSLSSTSKHEVRRRSTSQTRTQACSSTLETLDGETGPAPDKRCIGNIYLQTGIYTMAGFRKSVPETPQYPESGEEGYTHADGLGYICSPFAISIYMIYGSGTPSNQRRSSNPALGPSVQQNNGSDCDSTTEYIYQRFSTLPAENVLRGIYSAFKTKFCVPVVPGGRFPFLLPVTPDEWPTNIIPIGFH